MIHDTHTHTHTQKEFMKPEETHRKQSFKKLSLKNALPHDSRIAAGDSPLMYRLVNLGKRPIRSHILPCFSKNLIHPL